MIDVSHLSIFEVGKDLRKRVAAKENGADDGGSVCSESDSLGSYNIDDTEDIHDHKCEVHVGDIAVFVPTQFVQGDFSHLTFGTITEIPDDSDGDIWVDGSVLLDQKHQYAFIYKYNKPSKELSDVSKKMMCTANMTFVPDKLQAGSYTTDGVRFSAILSNRKTELNARVEADGLFQPQATSIESTRTVGEEDSLLTTAMRLIMSQVRGNQELLSRLKKIRQPSSASFQAPLLDGHDDNISCDFNESLSCSGAIDETKDDSDVHDGVIEFLNEEGVESVNATTNSTRNSDDEKAVVETSMKEDSRHEMEKCLSLALKDMVTEWKGSIMFNVVEVRNNFEPSDVRDRSNEKMVDICTYLNTSKSTIKRLYFPPHQYKPPPEGRQPKGWDGWESLKKALERAAWDGKCPIMCDGQSGKNPRSRAFRCSVSGKLRKSQATKGDSFRESSLINDRGNSRIDGKSGPRRRNVPMRTVRCPFQFVVRWDLVGFYVDLSRKQGNANHSGHIRPTADGMDTGFPARLLSEEERESMRQVSNATSNKGCARNYALQSLGRYISGVSLGNLFRDDSSGDDDPIGRDISRMIMNFERDKRVHYMTLSNVPGDVVRSTEELRGLLSTDVGETTEALTISREKRCDNTKHMRCNKSSEDLVELDRLVMDERSTRQLKKTDTVFIAVAWMFVPLFRFFCLCPEVIWVDVTSHSNNKGFHLFTVSCRVTSLKKQVVIMWIWIPNQRRFSFRWVFQHVFPNMVPKKFRDRVRLIMADGDLQQRNEILRSTKNVFVNAVFGSCGYHIVGLGFMRNGPSASRVASPFQDRWRNVYKRVQAWCYSWMKPGYCEDEDEFRVSKHLLIRFVMSGPVLEAAGGKKDIQEQLLSWLQNHVFVYSDDFLWYLRKKRRCYNTHHSSPHEGTNHGMKSHSAAVKATMGLTEASRTLLVQAEMKTAELNNLCWQEYHKPKKDMWSNYAHSNETTSASEGLLRSENSRARFYEPVRVGMNEFETHYVGDAYGEYPVSSEMGGQETNDSMHEIPSVVPRFRRVRRLKLVNGRMYCSCSKFECVGHHCVHMFAVAEWIHGIVGRKFEGFRVQQLAMRHRSVYLQFGYREETKGELWNSLESLADNEIDGPELGVEVPSVEMMPIVERCPDDDAVDRLKNYDTKEVKADMDENGSFEGMKSEVNVRGRRSGMRHLDMMFSESVNDADLPTALSVGSKARETLKQPLEEVCGMADQFGEDALKYLCSGINDIRVGMMRRWGDKPGDIGGSGTRLMTTVKHTGKARVKVTTSMYRNEHGKRKRSS